MDETGYRLLITGIITGSVLSCFWIIFNKHWLPVPFMLGVLICVMVLLFFTLIGGFVVVFDPDIPDYVFPNIEENKERTRTGEDL